jgi:hypothetical protein
MKLSEFGITCGDPGKRGTLIKSAANRGLLFLLRKFRKVNFPHFLK